MTEIAFHFNVPERNRYLGLLLKKVIGKGHKVVVLAPPTEHDALKHALHTLDAEQFVPACSNNAPDNVRNRSSVVFSDTPLETPHHDVLVNLTSTVSSGFERYNKVLEIVDETEENKHHARERWRYYSHRGYPIQRFDLQNKLRKK